MFQSRPRTAGGLRTSPCPPSPDLAGTAPRQPGFTGGGETPDVFNSKEEEVWAQPGDRLGVGRLSHLPPPSPSAH